MSNTLRIAMWSGPRNLSTAMMRSFENRPDCAVWDEPFYAAYLAATGAEHPMRNAVIAAGETDWRRVAERCLGEPPTGARIFYHKLMTHHMIPAFGRGWIGQVRNAFLIRDPSRVVASYGNKRAEVELGDIGFTEQYALFQEAADRLGHAPPVIDSDDVRGNPRGVIAALCEALGIPFDEHMLAWPEGGRDSDGAWAPHWYDAVNRSTGFAPPAESLPPLTGHAERVAAAARPYYEALHAHAISLSETYPPSKRPTR